MAHTTIDSARARECSAARSVAAYRLLLLAADVAPSSAAPRSSSVIELDDPAGDGEHAAGRADEVADHQAHAPSSP